MTDHAALVVEPPLEVPQPAAPEVCGTLTQEGLQLGLKEALNVGMSPLPKHSPYILIFQLPVQPPLVLRSCCSQHSHMTSYGPPNESRSPPAYDRIANISQTFWQL